MTAQMEADLALAIYQNNPRDTAEALLDEFFGVSEFKRQQRCVEVEFPCVITEAVHARQTRQRLEHGWSVERALSEPYRARSSICVSTEITASPSSLPSSAATESKHATGSTEVDKVAG